MSGIIYVRVGNLKEFEDVVVNNGVKIDDFYIHAKMNYGNQTVVRLSNTEWAYCSVGYFIDDGVDLENVLSYKEYMKKYGHTELAEKPEEDNINHPTHYNSYSFEVIDVIDEVVPHYSSSYAGNIQNAIKYIFRAPFKGTLRDDLKKAVWYLNHAIDIIDKENSDDEQSNTTK